MSPDEFECLAKLLRARSKSKEACRLVLVDGIRQCDVARALDLSPVLIAVSLPKYRKAERMIVDAFVTPRLK